MPFFFILEFSLYMTVLVFIHFEVYCSIHDNVFGMNDVGSKNVGYISIDTTFIGVKNRILSGISVCPVHVLFHVLKFAYCIYHRSAKFLWTNDFKKFIQWLLNLFSVLTTVITWGMETLCQLGFRHNKMLWTLYAIPKLVPTQRTMWALWPCQGRLSILYNL